MDKKDISIRIGNRIRSLLAMRKMTSKELARRTGLSTQTVSYLINGKKDACLSTLRLVEKALGCVVVVIPNEDVEPQNL